MQGQLEHPAIVPVYDLATAEDGSVYFTMKRIRGRTRADVWSLGAILFEILAGRPLVARKTIPQMFADTLLGPDARDRAPAAKRAIHLSRWQLEQLLPRSDA